MERKFDPKAWQTGGEAFTAESQVFGPPATSKVNAMTVEALGSSEGGTAIDTAFNMVIPSLQKALSETVSGLQRGLDQTGKGMTGAADAYRSTEEGNKQTAATAGKG